MKAKELLKPVELLAAQGALTNQDMMDLQSWLGTLSLVNMSNRARNEQAQALNAANARAYGLEASLPASDREATCQ